MLEPLALYTHTHTHTHTGSLWVYVKWNKIRNINIKTQILYINFALSQDWCREYVSFFDVINVKKYIKIKGGKTNEQNQRKRGGNTNEQD